MNPNSYSQQLPENSYQQFGCSSSTYISHQFHPNHNSYFFGSNQLQISNCERQDNITYPTTNEYSYWNDKSVETESTKFQNFINTPKNLCSNTLQHELSSCNDQDKIANSQLKQWCSNNLPTDDYFPKRTEPIPEGTSTNRYKKSIDPPHEGFEKYSLTETNYFPETNSSGIITLNLRDCKESRNDFQNFNYYDYYDDYSGLNNYLGLSSTPHTLQFDSLTQQTELSNEESDIIVEETDEDITDFSEDQDRKAVFSNTKCVVCNIAYVPQGIQFYHLTDSSPVTMTSQQPVSVKLKSLIGPLITSNNHICRECLGLLNSIDHLHTKLEDLKEEFITKYRTTYGVEQVATKSVQNMKQKIRKRFFSCYRCKVCSKLLSLKKYCQYHMLQHKLKIFLCEKCGFSYKNHKSFHRHVCSSSKRLHKFPNAIFSCSNCRKAFRTRSNLREHQNFCFGILPFICEFPNCCKKFASATRLKNHKKLKHENKFVAICSICNIGFVKLSDYKSHKISHNTEKKFQCQKCSKSYKTLSNLNFHLKSHQQELPFICSICQKGFMRKEYLETHVNNHKGIKNFICSVCPKKFSSQKNLDSHSKYHDGSIKKKTCNICEKVLTTSLDEHLRIHMNLREFECNHCDLKFNTKSTLRKHNKVKHNGQSTKKNH